jgi:hypothetical protein
MTLVAFMTDEGHPPVFFLQLSSDFRRVIGRTVINDQDSYSDILLIEHAADTRPQKAAIAVAWHDHIHAIHQR